MIKDLLKLAGIGLALFTAGLLFKSMGVTESAANAAGTPDSDSVITVEMGDGLKLYAWKSEAAADSIAPDKLPGLALLLPMMAHTHDSFDPFTSELNKIGYTTLAFDLRGHGLSVKAGNNTLAHGSMDKLEFAKMPDDIEALFHEFKTRNPGLYDYDDVVIIGASIGANTAGILLRRPWVRKAVLLSPGRDYRGLKPEEVMAVKGGVLGKDVYIAAGNDDTYSAESSQWLFDHYLGPKILKKYPGGDHGTNILHNVKDADKELLDWLIQKEKPVKK